MKTHYSFLQLDSSGAEYEVTTIMGDDYVTHKIDVPCVTIELIKYDDMPAQIEEMSIRAEHGHLGRSYTRANEVAKNFLNYFMTEGGL